MELYFQNHNSFEPTVVYLFDVGMGGIGDYLKFFLYLFNFCIENNIKFLLCNEHQIDKYIKCKFPQLYIKKSNIPSCTKRISKFTDLYCFEKNTFIVDPICMYSEDSKVSENLKKWKLSDLFYFTDDINQAIKNYTNENTYISIHLRLGDKFLETDKKFVVCPNDVRHFDENKLFDFIASRKDDTIYFFCDNKSYKEKIKNNFNYVNITDLEIEHTSLTNTSDKGNFNSVLEFAILSESESIWCASYSGFSLLASVFNNIPLRCI
jgi:hypothetical protein